MGVSDVVCLVFGEASLLQNSTMMKSSSILTEITIFDRLGTVHNPACLSTCILSIWTASSGR